MSDTQWPRFEVFQQERAGGPFQNVGSVHAPDADLALLNARDVFVRRPNCLGLWVVPAAMILARTAQEIEAEAAPDEAASPALGQAEPYYVFQKQTQKPADTYVTFTGEVEARSPAEALARARQTFDGPAWVWWVCPAQAVTRSEPDDVGSMFEPALDKPYRHPAYYHTVAEMHQLKKGQGTP